MSLFKSPKRKTPLGIYIHVPFCRSKCIYCDFYSLTEREDKLLDGYLSEALIRQNVEDMYVLLTDIQRSESVVIRIGARAEQILENAFGIPPIEDGSTLLPGVVSRKKQFIPKIMEAYQQLL